MDELTTKVLVALRKNYAQDPGRYVFVSTVLSELGVPFDASIGEALVSLQKQGLIEIMRTTNIRIRLTRKGAEALDP